MVSPVRGATVRFLYTSPPPKSYSDRAIVHVFVSELVVGIAISAVGVVGHRILGVAGGSSLQESTAPTAVAATTAMTSMMAISCFCCVKVILAIINDCVQLRSHN